MKNKTLHQVASQKVLADLQDAYLQYLENNCVSLGDYEDIGNGYSELVLADYINNTLDDIDEMIDQMDYSSFVEWFLETYSTDNSPAWVKHWTKDMAVTYYNILKGNK